jgi:hypothetical protein
LSAGFDEDQSVGIELGLIVRPCRSRRGNIRPILLGRPSAFFETDAVAVEEPPDRSEPRVLLELIEQTALDLFQCQVNSSCFFNGDRL